MTELFIRNHVIKMGITNIYWNTPGQNRYNCIIVSNLSGKNGHNWGIDNKLPRQNGRNWVKVYNSSGQNGQIMYRL